MECDLLHVSTLSDRSAVAINGLRSRSSCWTLFGPQLSVLLRQDLKTNTSNRRDTRCFRTGLHGQRPDPHDAPIVWFAFRLGDVALPACSQQGRCSLETLLGLV